MPVNVNANLCPQNHHCPAVESCSEAALIQTGFHAPEVIADKCIDCGICAATCPMGALTMEKKSSQP
jgi:Fe-S-cluster-containing hydrogenase component 2